MPKIVEKLSSAGVSQVSLIASIPYLFALPVMLLLAGTRTARASGDGTRRFRVWRPGRRSDLRLFERACVDQHGGLVDCGGRFYGSHAGFWPIPNMLLGGAGAAASIGLIIRGGNLGGSWGPYMIGFLTDKTGGFGASLIFLGCVLDSVGLLILCLRLAPRHPEWRSHTAEQQSK